MRSGIVQALPPPRVYFSPLAPDRIILHTPRPLEVGGDGDCGSNVGSAVMWATWMGCDASRGPCIRPAPPSSGSLSAPPTGCPWVAGPGAASTAGAAAVGGTSAANAAAAAAAVGGTSAVSTAAAAAVGGTSAASTAAACRGSAATIAPLRRPRKGLGFWRCGCCRTSCPLPCQVQGPRLGVVSYRPHIF